MEQWRAWLDAHVSRTPKPTAVSSAVPNVAPKPRIILFDVYGTLLAAHHGDLEQQLRHRLAQKSFVKTARFFGFSEDVGLQWAEGFYRAVAEEHERCRALGISRPEVLVESIWKELLLSVPNAPTPSPDPRNVAMYRELVANPVSPFEGVIETLETLRREGYLLGLASNAQFYTGPILEYVLDAALNAVFDPQWTFFSYELGFAKPDPHFFRLVATRARRSGLNPEDVLMVGNDPVNDVEAAHIHGLQAVLFSPKASGSPHGAQSSKPQIHRLDALVQALVGP